MAQLENQVQTVGIAWIYYLCPHSTAFFLSKKIRITIYIIRLPQTIVIIRYIIQYIIQYNDRLTRNDRRNGTCWLARSAGNWGDYAFFITNSHSLVIFYYKREKRGAKVVKASRERQESSAHRVILWHWFEFSPDLTNFLKVDLECVVRRESKVL